MMQEGKLLHVRTQKCIFTSGVPMKLLYEFPPFLLLHVQPTSSRLLSYWQNFVESINYELPHCVIFSPHFTFSLLRPNTVLCILFSDILNLLSSRKPMPPFLDSNDVQDFRTACFIFEVLVFSRHTLQRECWPSYFRVGLKETNCHDQRPETSTVLCTYSWFQAPVLIIMQLKPRKMTQKCISMQRFSDEVS
jgi:hypothetical protein